MRRILLSLTFMAAPAEATVLLQSTLGMALTGQIKVGSSFPVDLQSYSIGAAYIGDLRWSLLGMGKERFSLGLSMQAGNITYRTQSITAQGAHFGLSFRPAYSLGWGDKWIFQAGLPLFLYSRVSAAAFSEATIEGERIQSASLSDFTGSGGIGLSMRGLRRLGIKVGAAETVVGASLEFLQQNLQNKVDDVLSTAPRGSNVNAIGKSRSGSFQLSYWVITIEGGLLL